MQCFNPTTFTHLTAADVSFPYCFSFPPLPQLDRSGRITPRREEGLTRCRALAELLFKLWVKQDVSCIPASSDSQSASMALLDSVCRQCTAPFTAPVLQKMPRELCAQNLIQNAKLVCRSPGSPCLPSTLNLSSDIISFLFKCYLLEKCYHTYEGVTTDQVTQANRCVDDKKA